MIDNKNNKYLDLAFCQDEDFDNLLRECDEEVFEKDFDDELETYDDTFKEAWSDYLSQVL